jgi:hypothetical protein
VLGFVRRNFLLVHGFWNSSVVSVTLLLVRFCQANFLLSYRLVDSNLVNVTGPLLCGLVTVG